MCLMPNRPNLGNQRTSPLGSWGKTQAPIKEIAKKNTMVLPRIWLTPRNVAGPAPVAMGISTATRANELTLSMTADVMMPLATFDDCRPSSLSDTMVSETAVAVMVRPKMRAILVSAQKYWATK